MPERTRRQFIRRTMAEAGLVLVGGALFGGGYLLGSRRGAREWEEVGDRRLRLLAAEDGTANGQRRLLVDQWNAWHTDHQVEMVELPPIADLQYGAIHAALQSRSPDVDVVDLDIPWIADFAAAGHLEPFEDADTDGFLERPLETGRIDGTLFALPFNTNVGMLYYREGPEPGYADGTLTATEAESIGDWDDLRDTIGWVLEANPAFEGGIAMQLASYEGFTVNVWEYLLANGVAVDEGDGMIDFGERSAAAGVLKDLGRDLHEELDGGAHVILQDALQHNEDESLKAFQEGRVPFLRHWPQAIRALESCDLGFTAGVVPMPGGVLGGGSLAVSAHSERKNVSRALVEFLTGATSQQLLFERGGFAAARAEPYFDAIAQLENAPAGAGGADCEAAAGPRPEADELYDALTGEGPGRRPAVERYTQFSRAFRDVLHAELTDNPDPELGDLERRLKDAIDGK
ncbi:extracellular solute-binding protein [Glycomyces sp. A-F 0318]|uniref:extracellular solute-binding protein n=1 Tax=Glycomyces amatae TaxID=2881355 RepID=UPI001E5B366F|nr:extracellular solute-binding protein [Glycomyces amatae]MCD0444000.1 extracellular solute-binding protein [Glycomyces amatae]